MCQSLWKNTWFLTERNRYARLSSCRINWKYTKWPLADIVLRNMPSRCCTALPRSSCMCGFFARYARWTEAMPSGVDEFDCLRKYSGDPMKWQTFTIRFIANRAIVILVALFNNTHGPGAETHAHTLRESSPNCLWRHSALRTRTRIVRWFLELLAVKYRWVIDPWAPKGSCRCTREFDRSPPSRSTRSNHAADTTQRALHRGRSPCTKQHTNEYVQNQGTVKYAHAVPSLTGGDFAEEKDSRVFIYACSFLRRTLRGRPFAKSPSALDRAVRVLHSDRLGRVG